MTNTVKTALNLATALSTMSNVELEATFAFKVAKNMQVLEPIVRNFRDERLSVFENVVGKENIKPDGTITPNAEQTKEIESGVNAILEKEVDLSGLKKFSIESLKGVKITPEIVILLSPIIEES